MIDPPRLCQHENPRVAALLRAGRSETHPERDLEKTLVAVGAGGALLGASQAAAAGTVIAKVGLWPLAKWAGAGLVSGLVTVGGAHVAQQTFAPPAATSAEVQHSGELRSAPVVANLPRTPPGPIPPAVASFPGMPPAASPAVVPTAERAAASAPRPRAPAGLVPVPRPRLAQRFVVPTPSSAAKTDSTAIEVRLIDEAERALAQGRPRDALNTLARYRAEAPSRRLAPEARYLEMEAYLATGDTRAARSAARTLIEHYPAGPHTARARWVLGDQNARFADH